MQVQYREVKNGFECIHLPSIDLASVPHSHQRELTGDEPATPGTGRITKKSSKISFGMGSRRREQREKEKERERERSHDSSDYARPSVAMSTGTAGTNTVNLGATPSSASSSFFNVGTQPQTQTQLQPQPQPHQGTTTTNGEVEPEVSQPQPQPSPSSKSKMLPPIPRDFAPSPVGEPIQPFPTGEVDRDVFEHLGRNSLSVRFEISIVKVRFSPFVLFTEDVSSGPMASPPRNPIPTGKWRWMAVPNACEEGIDRVEALARPYDFF